MPGSPAERSHQLRIGDRLMTVNGVGVTGLRHDDIVRLIKESGSQVALTILPQTREAFFNNGFQIRSPRPIAVMFLSSLSCVQLMVELHLA